jgi:hypothetical protein
MPTPTLAQTQQLFWKLITAPEGAASGRAALGPSERAVAEAFVRGGRRLSPLERLDVYADMYFYRIRDCLKDDFGAVAAVVGDAAFHNLITDYLLVHPSAHFSLRHVGKRLPGFVRSHALIERWPYLADLATLEWAIMEAFEAADAEPILPASLTAIPPERWAELRFESTPSLRVLRLSWPVHDVWAQAQGQQAAEDVRPAPTVLRVWRQNLRVFHRSIDVSEGAALDALSAGATFGDVCEAIAAAARDATGAERAAALLHAWLADGLLTAHALDPDHRRSGS